MKQLGPELSFSQMVSYLIPTTIQLVTSIRTTEGSVKFKEDKELESSHTSLNGEVEICFLFA